MSVRHRVFNRPAQSLEAREGGDDGLGLLDDNHMAGRRDLDEFGAGNASAKGIAIGRGDHSVALAPDQHGFGADAVEPLVETAIGYREQHLAGHRQLAGVADDKGFEKLRIVEIRPGSHHPLAEFRIVEQQAGNSCGNFEKRSGIGCASSHSPAGAIRPRRSTSRGAIAAISAAIMPPSEWPTRIGRSSPSVSRTSNECKVTSSMSRKLSAPSESP